jgi:hypothetical protein
MNTSRRAFDRAAEMNLLILLARRLLLPNPIAAPPARGASADLVSSSDAGSSMRRATCLMVRS